MHEPRKNFWPALVAMTLLSILPGALPARAIDADTTFPPTTGDPAPGFTLKNTDGKNVYLQSFRGKIILLSFWDCYADACFTSMEAFDVMAKKYPPEQFALVTICFAVPPALAENNYADLLKRCSAGQVILLDPEKKVHDLYRVQAAPTTYLIGRDLVIRELVNGVATLRGADFTKRVDELVSQPAGTYRVPVPPPAEPNRPPAPIQPEDQPKPQP